ncbi:PRC-barrel domain-containing protein [uncultured Jannaschia sp.]|uniref:PRC-barrel domain-containing protein n=1 Tax=uncultured Jannaschia sp. TaxID=293347 RepID=UPI00261BB9AD|nr:PRC-barrel domain-containing protein [uncultured Jannaschia sp.]
MKSTFSALLIGTALTVPFAAHAQTRSVETACADLQAVVANGLPDGVEAGTISQLIESGDGEACLVEMTRLTQSDTGATVADTAQTTLRLQDEVTIQGRVLLDQSPPRVNVESGAAEVQIDPGNPSVTVAEQQAEILVRQAPTNVTIDMPSPTIRIEQPAPEIVITMPDPNVTVGAAQPQVRVVQADPRVTVTQAPPAVDLELQRVEDGGEGGFEVTDSRSGQAYQPGMAPEAITSEDAEVTVTSSDPQVVMSEATGEAEIRIERAEPTVRFEQADPIVDVTSQGEPQVEFVQSGEPVVTFEQAEASEASDPQPAMAVTDEAVEPQTPGMVATDADPEVPAVMTDTSQSEPAAASRGPVIERAGYEPVQTDEFEADSLTGSSLYGSNDENIGEVSDLVMNDAGTVDGVLVEVGGFLGLGEKEVEIPFDRLTILRSEAGDIRAYIEATEDELESMPSAQ